MKQELMRLAWPLDSSDNTLHREKAPYIGPLARSTLAAMRVSLYTGPEFLERDPGLQAMDRKLLVVRKAAQPPRDPRCSARDVALRLRIARGPDRPGLHPHSPRRTSSRRARIR
jgi:hypothetical protein